MKHSFHENRLIHQTGGESIEARFEAADKQIALEDRRREAMGKAAEVTDRLNDKRIGARIINAERNTDLLKASERLFLAGAAPDSPLYRGALEKAGLMRQIYASHESYASIDGLRFGMEGGDLKVFDADETFVKWALSYVVSQVLELRKDTSKTPRIKRQRGESDADFNARNAAALDQAAQAREFSAGYNNEQIEQWQLVAIALQEYQSEFQQGDRVMREVKANPRRINDVSKKWKQENPASYVKALTLAAKSDPSVLTGKEKEFEQDEFVRILEDVTAERPQAIEFYPDSLRGTTRYRAAMFLAVSRDGNVLRLASREYDKYWKVDADGKDIRSEFRDLAVAAINQNPKLFFEDALWRKDMNAKNFNEFIILNWKLLPHDKIIENMIGEKDRGVLRDFEGGYLGYLHVFEPIEDSLLIALGTNGDLVRAIREEDVDLYRFLTASIQHSSNPDLRNLFRKEHIREDEDTSSSMLDTLMMKLYEGGKLKENASRILTEEMRLNPELLRNIPDHVKKSEVYREKFVTLYKLNGDLYRYAPDEWKKNRSIAFSVLEGSASAYAHLDPTLQGDPELLYAALLSENKDKKGNMFFKDIGPNLRRTLGDAIPDPDAMLRELILGIEAEWNFSPENVHSLLDRWTPEMKKNPELLEAYLKLSAASHPEYMSDIPVEFRTRVDFIKPLLTLQPKFFSYLGEDHGKLTKESQDEYRNLLRDLDKTFDRHTFTVMGRKFFLQEGGDTRQFEVRKGLKGKKEIFYKDALGHDRAWGYAATEGGKKWSTLAEFVEVQTKWEKEIGKDMHDLQAATELDVIDVIALQEMQKLLKKLEPGIASEKVDLAEITNWFPDVKKKIPATDTAAAKEFENVQDLLRKLKELK